MPEKKKDQADSWEGMFWKPHKYNERINLKSGSYLRTFCPRCDEELTEGNVIRLEVINLNDESGWIELSTYLNVFERKTDIKLPEDQEVKDLRCRHCHRSLVVEGRRCGTCNSHAAGIVVGVSNTKVPFLICTRIGCHWHAILPDDEDQIILDDSREW